MAEVWVGRLLWVAGVVEWVGGYSRPTSHGDGLHGDGLDGGSGLGPSSFLNSLVKCITFNIDVNLAGTGLGGHLYFIYLSCRFFFYCFLFCCD